MNQNKKLGKGGGNKSLLWGMIQETPITKMEKEQVEEFAKKNQHRQVIQFDDAAIREEQRGKKLRVEFERLAFLKKQFWQEMEEMFADEQKVEEEKKREIEQEDKDRALFTESLDQNSAVFSEILHRSKMRATDTIKYIYGKPKYMQILEENCPTLFDHNRSFRNSIVKAILLNEDIDPTMFLMQLEALEMIENGEITQQEASMKLSKMVMQQDKVIDFVKKQTTTTSSSFSAASSPSSSSSERTQDYSLLTKKTVSFNKEEYKQWKKQNTRNFEERLARTRSTFDAPLVKDSEEK